MLVEVKVPEIRVSRAQSEEESAPRHERTPVNTSPESHSPVRQFLLSRGNSALADRCFRWLMVLCAFSIFAIVALIAWRLMVSFFFKAFVNPDTHQSQYWDPVNGYFSAVPFIYGTLVSSFLSLLNAVPLGVGVAIFLTEMCPRALRGPLAFLTELLAAIPSIVYGLWAMY